MFDFFKINKKLDKHDKVVTKAISKAMSAVSDLTKVNNQLVTMSDDVAAKAIRYTNIGASAQEKMEANKNMINTLNQLTANKEAK